MCYLSDCIIQSFYCSYAQCQKVLKLADPAVGHGYCVPCSNTCHYITCIYHKNALQYMWGWELWTTARMLCTQNHSGELERRAEQMEMNVIICRAAFFKGILKHLALEHIILIIHLIFENEMKAWTRMFSTSLSPSQRSSNWSWRWTRGSQTSQPVINRKCFLIWA